MKNSHLVIFDVLLGCTANIPFYDNAFISAGANLVSYPNGHVITYMCDIGFQSVANSITCTCDTTNGVNNPGWVCAPPDLIETCLRRKKMILTLIPVYDFENIVYHKPFFQIRFCYPKLGNDFSTIIST